MWYYYIIFSGIVRSLFGFSEKYYLLNYLTTTQLLLYTNITKVIILIIFSIFYKKKILNNKKINNKLIISIFIYGLLSVSSLYFIINAYKKKDVYKVNLVLQISTLVSTIIIGYYVFNENITLYNCIGILFAIISMCLLLC